MATLVAGFAAAIGVAATIAQEAPPIFPLGDVQPPEADTRRFIANPLAAAQLGKALFWDIKAGSDGQACASCHFHAGADIRLRNQVNPGGPDLVNQVFDQSFDVSNDTTGPNKVATAGEFPFTQVLGVSPNTQVDREKNDRMSSQGSFAGLFVGGSQTLTQPAAIGKFRGRRPVAAQAAAEPSAALPGTAENCVRTPEEGNPFHPGGAIMFRKVEPRQTPSVINAAFNHRQFWDGRARSVFNGVDPFGAETNAARADSGILFFDEDEDSVVLQHVEIANASLASQAVGPPLSSFEMSCEGRIFADIGRKLIPMVPLSEQNVHRDDSLFSQRRSLVPRDPGTKGLTTTYEALIRRAFSGRLWSAEGKFTINPDGSVVEDEVNGYTQMEHNFSLFWGLAIQEYERLLISNDTKFDRGDLNAQETLGMDVFINKGRCADCHSGPLLSGATTIQPPENVPPPAPFIESMTMGDGRNAIYDAGFYNIGVRPTVEDRGVGGNDPWGNPLSLTRSITNPANRDAVEGAFKTPILRNVALTPPYMHNGGLASLEEVVDFYDRGGHRVVVGDCDTTGLDPANATVGTKECSNFDPDVLSLNLEDDEKAGLVAFLKALTDDRVACHSGIFDHPSLPLTDGHEAVRANPADPNDFSAKDVVRELPATGEAGLDGIGKPCFPNTGNLFGEMQTVFQAVAPAPAGFSYAPQPPPLN